MILQIEVLNLLKIIFLSALAVGFFFMILNGLIKRSNYKRKGLYNFLLGLAFIVLFLGSYFYDKYIFGITDFTKYYALLGSSAFYTLVLAGYNFIKGIQRNERVFKGTKSSKPKDFIYILLKYQDGFLLEKTNEKYLASVRKMKTNFHDEDVSNFVKSYGECLNVSYKGVVYKKDYSYYCYLIETNTYNQQLEFVNQFELTQIMMSAEDKEIVLSIILRNDFILDKRI